jgi:hypothetical protein
LIGADGYALSASRASLGSVEKCDGFSLNKGGFQRSVSASLYAAAAIAAFVFYHVCYKFISSEQHLFRVLCYYFVLLYKTIKKEKYFTNVPVFFG